MFLKSYKTNNAKPSNTFVKKSVNNFLLLGIFVFAVSFGFFFNQKSNAQLENLYDAKTDEIAGINSLMSAVVANDVEGVKFFLKAKMVSVNAKNLGGATALNIACRENNFEIAKILIDSNADVNEPDNEGWTALMRAALSGNSEITELLISHNASANKVNKVDESAIIHASISNCAKCLTSMFSKYNFIDLMNNDLLRSQLNEAFIIANNHDNSDTQKIIATYLDKLNNNANKGVATNQDNVAKVFRIISEDENGKTKIKTSPGISISKAIEQKFVMKKTSEDAKNLNTQTNNFVVQSDLSANKIIQKFKFEVGAPGRVSRASSPKKSNFKIITPSATPASTAPKGLGKVPTTAIKAPKAPVAAAIVEAPIEQKTVTIKKIPTTTSPTTPTAPIAKKLPTEETLAEKESPKSAQLDSSKDPIFRINKGETVKPRFITWSEARTVKGKVAAPRSADKKAKVITPDDVMPPLVDMPSK